MEWWNLKLNMIPMETEKSYKIMAFIGKEDPDFQKGKEYPTQAVKEQYAPHRNLAAQARDGNWYILPKRYFKEP